MATWASNGLDQGGSGGYVAGTQSVQYLHDNFASNGDTITLPTGSFTWGSGATKGVSITKSITISGSGYTPNTNVNFQGTGPGAPSLSTTITFNQPGTNGAGPTAVTLTSATAGGSNFFRMTGLYFTGSVPSSVNPTGGAQATYFNFAGQNSVTGPSNTDPFRIDNCTFDGGTNLVVMGWLSGDPIGCVIDHCTFLGGGASEMVHNNGHFAGTLNSQKAWTDDLSPGSNQMIYFEDCIFQLTGYATATGQLGTCGSQSYYGARTVTRYSLLNFTLIDSHGNVDVNTRWTEIYKNQLFIPSTNTGNTFLAQIRGGSGVVWGNSFATGSQTSLGAIVSFYTDEQSSNNLNPAVSGTQPGYGPGAGIFSSVGVSNGPTTSPVYIWQQATGMSANTVNGTGGWNPLQINGTNANIYVSTNQPSSMQISEKASQVPPTTYNYQPYTYPHPLTGLSNAPGFGLSAAVDTSITNYILGITSGAYSPPANNYMACYSNIFTSSTKAGATEWTTSPNTAYARVAMGAGGSGWTIAAYASGVGVVWNNTYGVATAGVIGATQSLFSVGFLDSATIGAGVVDFFCDITGGISIPIGQCVALPAGNGVVFTTY